MEIAISSVGFKSLIRNLAPAKYIYKHSCMEYNFTKFLYTTCVYIATINTRLCNTDTKIPGHVTQTDDRWVDDPLYQEWLIHENCAITKLVVPGLYQII